MRSEARNVLALSGLIIGAVALYVVQSVARNSSEGNAAKERDLLPYQRLARTLPAPDQAIFKELQGAVPALERIRAETGRWPEVSTLAAANIVPFAAAEEQSGPREWRFLPKGFFVNYFGFPADPMEAAWLMMVQEPDPNSPPDTAPNDETHHRLPDGTVLHVTFWTRKAPDQIMDVLMQPQLTGWIQVSNDVPTPFRR